jgi:hypothetical protein
VRVSRRWRPLELLVGAALLAGCGGGERPPDVVPSTGQPAPQPVAGPDSFLLFPNPQVTPDGTPPAIDSDAYAQAYYAAIDPNGNRTTLADWKAVNGFDQPGGVQVTAVFGDARDLGYGRRMTGRRNADGTIAFVVENYLVNPGGGGYGSSINIDAAVVQDRQWIVSVNAIEYSAGPNAGPTDPRYAKFYSFDPLTGKRKLRQDLDGRGAKALPGACVSCHGGRGDPLTADGRFPLLQSTATLESQRGDLRGRLHVFEVDALAFADTPGYKRADQEALLKTLNEMVLCTYPTTEPQPTALAQDRCRPAADPREYQGTAAVLIKGAYGNDMASPVYATPPVPAGWDVPAVTAAERDLYLNVIVPACRSCHIVRGSGAPADPQSAIDFTTLAKFRSYNARTKYHVFDRGDMPLAKVVFDRFWSTADKPEQLARFLDDQGGPSPQRDTAGAVLKPGHPYADPGPDRVVGPASTPLRGNASLYASTYQWSIVSGPNGAVPPSEASLSNADTATPTFTAGVAALGNTYMLQLVVGNGSTVSPPTPLKVFVGAADPASVGFAAAQQALTDGGCLGCHGPVSVAPRSFAVSAGQSIGDLYNVLRGLVNFGDINGSQLLRKPSDENHHSAGAQPGFSADAAYGDPAREQRDIVVDWILNGAPGP